MELVNREPVAKDSHTSHNKDKIARRGRYLREKIVC